ncbi:MAG: ABC transporter substrate-binding protein, partial [Gallionella sp.]
VERAFSNGRLHIAGLTLDEALGLRQSVPDLQVFLVVDVSQGADVLMVRRGINSLTKLRGKRIGVEKTALGAYYLSLILQAAKLSKQDVKIVSLQLDEHVNAYRSGKVDAVVTFGATRGQLAREGAVVLFDSTKVPGKIVDVLVVRAADAVKRRVQMDAFVNAWFRALQVIQSDPARANPLLAQREQIKVAELEETLRGLLLVDLQKNLQQLSGDPPPLLQTAGEIQRILIQEGLTTGSDDMSLLINSRIVTEAGLD